MKWLPEKVKRLLGVEAERHSPETVNALRVSFRERYHGFRMLLGANQRCHEIMADMGEALQGDRPFGMAFVRAHCTGIAVNVMRMIQNLDRLAPGKYPGLAETFPKIRERIDSVLQEKRSGGNMDLILPLASVDKSMTDLVGSKMANIGEIIQNVGLKVPPGFAVTTRAFERFIQETGIQEEINRQFQTADLDDVQSLFNLSAHIRQLILRAEIPADIRAAIENAWQRLAKEHAAPKLTVALRSSAVGEDTAESSFAGQYLSELNIAHENLLDAYKAVVASKYSLQAIVYRQNRGFRDEDIPMAVGCMAMVDARSGGVAYSRNPVDADDDAIHINAAWGLPKSVVDGTVACDVFVVSRGDPPEILEQEIHYKERKFVCYAEEGVCRIDLTEEAMDQASLSPDEMKALARIAMDLEAYHGLPQDIEWAVDKTGAIFILQCRPLKQAARRSPRPKDAPDAEAMLAQGGVTASPGAAFGEVFVALKSADALRFPQGGILVVRQALPSWASLVGRAAAILTEQGGVAGHLANVAREFGVPAVFNLEGITGRLETGAPVTVDADRREVYAGKIDALLTPRDRPKLMAGSPVYDVLRRTADHILPLNLLDPAVQTFRPENCRTFHDMTRFIHEKSVQEMFRFGKDHHFPERSAKQLHYKVPMQWWVLNLDDGFKTEIKGKYVKLDNIASIPMLAFWDGFAAIPWDGPPAIDRRGLASVMFQSTANTALTPGIKSQYAQHNYFMISKHFCSLNSRLGYHFSTLEALVSERKSENYVSFQFKGGAADQSRRMKRVHFIREILEDNDFRLEVREDHLTARAEGFDQLFMESRIKILGYLSLHTRQLDMIMSNPAQVAYYRGKIDRDIETLLTPSA